MRRARVHALPAVMALAILGCGQQSDRWKDARPETAAASGVVIFQGEPLEGAVVVFQPTDPDGIGASALTDEEGKFELQTFPPEFGAVPGKYVVSITKTETPESPDDTGNPDDPPPVFAISVIPEKYGIPTESELVAEVPEEGTDDLVFELKQ